MPFVHPLDLDDTTIGTRLTPVSGRGTTVGSYCLLERLGEGSQGEVWLAEQTAPMHRQVAFKVMKSGIDSGQVVARFETERQALALMDHPAIATVFDGGITAEGRPFFAMEYVKGEPITEYCDRYRLPIRERLELFLQVCDGVQHAHQKGVIHRDLKPSNILVTNTDDRAVPKIIDFGVAKATARQLTDRPAHTELGSLIGTLDYMSPEQAEMGRLDIDTRTDVYALGVLLYKLITGALPFESAGFDERRRTIREVDPPPPSSRVTEMGTASLASAWNRHTEPTRLAGQLHGDLDWITMKALEKDRTRRYQTANALAQDVRRHLANEPVYAGPPSAVYRAGKFVRRHRFGVAVATLFALVLFAFGVVMSLQAQRIAIERDRANREAEAARRVTEFLTGLFKVSDPGEARGNSVTAREILDKGVRNVDATLNQQPELQARLQATMGTVYTSLGLYGAALPPLDRAVSTNRRVLGNSHLQTLQSINDLANVYWFQNKFEHAEPLYTEVVTGRRRVLGADHRDTLRAEYDLASLYFAEKRFSDAERLMRATLEQQRRVLGNEDPDTVASMSNLGSLYWAQGRFREAEPLAAQVLEISRRRLGEDHPDTLLSMHNLATTYDMLGRSGDAESLFLRCIAAKRHVLGDGHPETIRTQLRLAESYVRQKRYAEAEGQTLAAFRALADEGADHGFLQWCVNTAVKLYDAWGKPAEAAEWRARLKPDATK